PMLVTKARDAGRETSGTRASASYSPLPRSGGEGLGLRGFLSCNPTPHPNPSPQRGEGRKTSARPRLAAKWAGRYSLQDVHNIPILNDIRLPLQAINPMGFRLFHGADPFEVLVTDDFRPHKALGQVGVDLARPLDRIFSFGQIPGPALVLAHGEENEF